MAGTYTYEYPRPAVTVDVVALAHEPKALDNPTPITASESGSGKTRRKVPKGDGLRVLLIQRRHDPFAGRYALPGGFLEMDEPIETAARRELEEETGLRWNRPLHDLGVYGAPGRDPRGRTISIVYIALMSEVPPVIAADDAVNAVWLPWNSARTEPLAFDHHQILADTQSWLSRALRQTDALALFPNEFTLEDIRTLHQNTLQTTRWVHPWIAAMRREGRLQTLDAHDHQFRQISAITPDVK